VRSLERHTEAAVVQYANSIGIRSYKMNGTGHRSMPDRLFLIPYNKVVFIEFKRAGEVCTTLQLLKIAELRANGFTVEVVEDRYVGMRLLYDALVAKRISEDVDTLPSTA